MDKAEVEVNDKGTVDDTVDKPKVDDEVVGAEATQGRLAREWRSMVADLILSREITFF